MHKQTQRGFIQNFIIPGIILIGVVIAGIAMLASNSGGSDTSNEKAAMVANTVIGQGLSVSGAIQRAIADGGLVVTDAGAAYSVERGAPLSNLLVQGKYLTAMPAAIQGLEGMTDWQFYAESPGGGSWTGVVVDYNDKGGNVVQVGTDFPEDVLFVSLGSSEFAGKVCLRINNKLHGTSTDPNAINDMPSADPWYDGVISSYWAGIKVTEGCGSDMDGNFNYFKVINAK